MRLPILVLGFLVACEPKRTMKPVFDCTEIPPQDSSYDENMAECDGDRACAEQVMATYCKPLSATRI